jgi:hypothetical protein
LIWAAYTLPVTVGWPPLASVTSFGVIGSGVPLAPFLVRWITAVVARLPAVRWSARTCSGVAIAANGATATSGTAGAGMTAGAGCS